MIRYISQAIRLTVLSLLICIVLYPAVILLVAKAAPAGGKGERIEHGGRTVGYALIGQSFTEPGYFQGRPSAVAYNAAGSGGSNKGPTNPDYLQEVRSRVDSFLAHHPGVRAADIPSDLVTASGSGLDPDISPDAALVQVDRVAKARGLAAEKVRELVHARIRKPLFGALGTSRVNVLDLNVALNDMTP